MTVTECKSNTIIIRATFRPRELQVLHLVAKLRTNTEIAEILGMTERTAYNIISTIMRLVNVHERLHLIRYAQENGYANIEETDGQKDTSQVSTILI